MNNPLVSILAPCYNGAKYLPQFFDSVLEQEYKYLEVVLINDGSVDNSEEVAMAYKPKLEKVGMSLLYEYQTNAGIGAAIDRALKLMHGDYFTWIGIDDYYHPLFCKTLVEFMEANPKYCVVRNDGYVVDEEDHSIVFGTMAENNHDKFNEHVFDNAILEHNWQFGYSMVRTSDFVKVNPTRSIYPSRDGQNWQILLPLLYNGLCAFIEEPLYYVLNNSHSVSRDPAKGGKDKLLRQKEEYRKILLTTLSSFDCPERAKYEVIVKEKYARMEMQIAYSYKDKILLEEKYSELKRLGRIRFVDRMLRWRCYSPILDKFSLSLRKTIKFDI